MCVFTEYDTKIHITLPHVSTKNHSAHNYSIRVLAIICEKSLMALRDRDK